MSGKGDKRRPSAIPQRIASLRWDLAFSKNLSDDDKRKLRHRIAYLEKLHEGGY